MVDLIGLEVEVAGVPRAHLREITRDIADISLHDDGSIRQSNYAIANTPITPIKIHGMSYTPFGAEVIDIYGPEIVTRPLSLDNMRIVANKLADRLFKLPSHPRGSIHVHLSKFETWEHVQRFIKWMYYLEAPLFRIAGLGQRHRGELLFNGEENDYRYCRPLSKPIYIYDQSSNRVPLLNAKGLIGATTFGEFLSHWGRLDLYWNRPEDLHHYCPHRLHAINLAALVRYRTLELRFWNGVYKHIPEAVEISNKLFELSELEDPPVKVPMVLGGTYDFTAQDMSDVLHLDITHLWWKRWPRAATHELVSHYTNHLEMPSASNRVRVIEWGPN